MFEQEIMLSESEEEILFFYKQKMHIMSDPLVAKLLKV